MEEAFPPVPESGRVFREELRVGPADVSPSGRARLDQIARWLQDVAYHDVVDGGVDGAGFWIVRRTRIRVERFPHFPEDVQLATFASGVSHALAERRTSLQGAEGAALEAVSVWVNVDPETQTPARLPERFLDAYRPAPVRRPRSRLRHPPPADDATRVAWTFREGDLDIVGHVNNARYWAIVDEILLPAAEPIDVEMEHRAAAPVGDAVVLRAADGGMLWVTAPGGEVYASAALTGAG